MSSQRLVLWGTVFIISWALACQQKDSPLTQEKVVIAGKIKNFDPKTGSNILKAIVNDNGTADQLNYQTQIDSTGSFWVTFERYYPQDVMILYKTNFRVIIHPGDSLYIEFDGTTDDRVKIFESIKFGGDAADLNSQFARYLKLYFENRIDYSIIMDRMLNLEPNEFVYFADSLQKEQIKISSQFIAENSPDDQLIHWINTSIKYSYYQQLLDYPSRHNRNQAVGQAVIDNSYYDFIQIMDPLERKDLICTDTRWFINRYLYYYIWQRTYSTADSIAKANPDSLIINTILQSSSNKGLVKQMALNEYINAHLSNYNLASYEENKAIIDSVITENYLLEPIHRQYQNVKYLEDNPALAKGIKVLNVEDETAENLWLKILEENYGNVIYIDCWATWCQPCVGEFPHSKKLMADFQDQPVRFIYLCMDSQKKNWQLALREYQLKGQHYFLNKSQGAYFNELLNITGFPTYVIIDKDGKIRRNGFSFRPSIEDTKNIINELL